MKRNIMYRIYSILKNEGWSKLPYLFLDRYGNYLPSYAKSMEDIYKWVEKNIDAYDIYSFDIFDTLLRKIIHPTDLTKQLACNYLSGILKRQRIYIGSERLLIKRLEIENMLKGKALIQNHDAEFKLEDVLQSLLKASAADDTVDSAELLDYETGLEELITEPMPYVENVLKLIRKTGKKIICISDTYFSGSQISKILEKNNLLHFFDHIYVSSDILLNKKSSNLFRHVIKNENGKIVHIDNCISDDVYMARRAGIKSIWYKSKSEKKRTHKLAKLLLGKNKFKYMNAIVKRKPSNNIMFNLGYDVLGPVLTACIHNVIEKIKGQDINRVFFVSRDGFILKKIHKVLVSGIYDEYDDIQYGDYLCINKYTLTLPSINHIGYEEIEDLEKLVKKNATNFTLYDILKSYSLYTDEFVNLLSRNGIVNIHDTIKDVHKSELIREFISNENIQNTIESLSKHAKTRLYNYLATVGFMGQDKIAIIDSISSGRTAALLSAALGNREDFPKMRGYYLCYEGEVTSNENNQSTLENGLLVDYRTESPLSYKTLVTFCAISELLTQPNHGIPVGYRALNEKTIPIFKKTASSVNYKLRSVVNNGILSYARDYAKYFRVHQLDPEQLIAGAKESASRYISLPNRRDVEELKKYYQTMTWPTEMNKKLIEGIHFMDFIKIKRIKEKMTGALWIEGTLNNIPIPGLHILYKLLYNPYYYLKRYGLLPIK